MNRVLALRVALIVSVAFNIALVLTFVQHSPPPPPHNAQDFLAHVTRHMPAEDATTLRETFDKYQPALNDKRQAADVAMASVRTELERDKIDPAALATAMDHARTAKMDAQQVFQDAIQDAAPRLSREARQELMPDKHDGPGKRP